MGYVQAGEDNPSSTPTVASTYLPKSVVDDAAPAHEFSCRFIVVA
jgi:hypothetical protein